MGVKKATLGGLVHGYGCCLDIVVKFFVVFGFEVLF